MAKQKDGITDLTKVLISAANKFTDAEYTKLTKVIFALLHGVNYGYDTMDQRFLNDAQDLKFVHNADKKFKKSFYYYFLGIGSCDFSFASYFESVELPKKFDRSLTYLKLEVLIPYKDFDLTFSSNISSKNQLFQLGLAKGF